MQTKLSVYCDRLIEAGWLAALVVTPLFFNVYSNRVFEPDKLTLLRSIALFMAVAWLVKTVDAYLFDRGQARGSAQAPVRGQPSKTGRGPASLGFVADAGSPVGVSFPVAGIWQRVTAVPLVLPALLMVLVYILSTITSVDPYLSLWGSYQRLQGTYTELSYITIFFLTLGTLRTREQLDRLITTALLTGLPIALYGIVQHFGQDPLPWVGDVVSRVASTMGNSIFVAAYLIMLVPLTVGRLVEANTAAGSDETAGTKAVLGIGIAFYLLLQMAAWYISPTAGTLAATTTIVTWLVVAVLLGKPVVPFLQVSAYSILLSTQLMCIIFSQSRGPWLGLVFGLGFFALMWALAQRMRWVALGLVGLAILIAGFLITLNVRPTPLSALCAKPYVGRMCSIFETEGPTTGRVRVLIWEGAVKLIGADPVRALIGYGPETMHVAYNPYYPPALGQIEARNASPDRSHNETFDALVITGGIGFVAYLLLFTSIFYYGLKWMGLIRNAAERNAFLTLWLGEGVVFAAAFLAVEGSWKFLGVALPLGMMVGFFLYLASFAVLLKTSEDEEISTLRKAVVGVLLVLLATPIVGLLALFLLLRKTREEDKQDVELPPLRLILVALLSAIVAHFIEIHFGIAIAATRTYFWIYAALMVLAGYLYHQRPGLAGAPDATQPARASALPATQPLPAEAAAFASRSKRQRARRAEMRSPVAPQRRSAAESASTVGQRGLLVLSVIAGIIMLTMVFDFFSPQVDLSKNLILVWLMAFTWLFAGVLIVGETRSPEQRSQLGAWLSGLGIYAVVSGLMFLLYAAVHIASLSPSSDLGNILVPYYLFVFLAMATSAGFLLWRESLPQAMSGGVRVVAYPIVGLALLFILFVTNIQVVQADIYYKQGWIGYHQRGEYDTAIALYQKALQLQPEQDFYLLFEGKAMLEKAQRVQDVAQRDVLMERALGPLQQARALNPLNTDHVANLGRLYQTWGELTTDPTKREERLKKSDSYYADALKLSSNNAQLWNEWGRTKMLLGDNDGALAKFQHSLELDTSYDLTYFSLGELYRTQSKWPEAISAYEEARKRNPGSVQTLNVLAYAYVQAGRTDEAVAAYRKMIELAPNEPSAHRNLALLYRQLGQHDQALTEARAALALSPQDQSVQSLVNELEQQK